MNDDNRAGHDIPVSMGDTASLKTTATGQLAHLSDLDDMRIVEGEPDIRGWSVRGVDGETVGKVEDLLVDTASMKVRYIEVRLEKAIAKDIGRTADLTSTPISEMAADARGLPNDDRRSDDEAGRFMLIPIGVVRLDNDADDVLLDAQASQMVGIPAYDRKALTREHETDVLSRFSRGDSMSRESSGATAGAGMGSGAGGGLAGAGLGAGIMGTSAGSGGLGTSDVMNAARPSDAQSNADDSFYSDRSFDDRSFMNSRGRDRDDVKYFTRADEDERARARQSGVDRDVDLTDDDVDTNSSRDLTR